MSSKTIALAVALGALIMFFFLSRAGWKTSEQVVEIHNEHEHASQPAAELDARAAKARDMVQNAQNSEDVMAGVMELREILKQDSNHIASLEIMAELSLSSGQLDKAMERYEKLISLQPENQEYRERFRQICLQSGRTDCDELK